MAYDHCGLEGAQIQAERRTPAREHDRGGGKVSLPRFAKVAGVGEMLNRSEWLGSVKFEPRIKEIVENLPNLAALVEPLLIVRRVLREQIVILHRRLLAIVRDDDVGAQARSLHQHAN
jgi:hypothetical protein